MAELALLVVQCLAGEGAALGRNLPPHLAGAFALAGQCSGTALLATDKEKGLADDDDDRDLCSCTACKPHHQQIPEMFGPGNSPEHEHQQVVLHRPRERTADINWASELNSNLYKPPHQRRPGNSPGHSPPQRARAVQPLRQCLPHPGDVPGCDLRQTHSWPFSKRSVFSS